MISNESVGVRRSGRKRRTPTWFATEEWADESEACNDPDLLPPRRHNASACDTGKTLHFFFNFILICFKNA